MRSRASPREPFDAEDGGPGGLGGGGVLTGGLAELLRGLGDVEDVVDDLEGEAGVFAEGAEAGRWCSWLAPATCPPATMETVMRAPVLARWICSTSSAVGGWRG